MCETELCRERYELALERIREIPEEHFGVPAMEAYFASVAEFILLIDENKSFLETEGGFSGASAEQLQSRNLALYRDILPENYETSYGNPAYAVSRLGEDLGQELSFLYAELRSMIGFCYEGKTEELVIRMELFAEVYTAVIYEWGENRKLPSGEDIRKILYWFASDYADMAAERRVREQVCPEDGLAARILCGSDLSDLRYLYAYGEYVGENELEMAGFMNSLPEETIALMADTYTEGYRIGFEVTNKDLSKKQTVELYYPLGFERMMRRAVENFEKMGLKPVMFRYAVSVLDNPSLTKNGFCGSSPNRQYEYDHKDDKALFLDKNYVNRRLEVTRTAFEEYKEQARGCAGPAVVESLGEKAFEPVVKRETLKLNEEQNRLWVEYRSQAGEIRRQYIPEEERSFTIIAFPVPEIGSVFRELFEETIRINTLDYMVYRKVQQNIIDVLDTAEYCEIKGGNGNRTDLRVKLYQLRNPEKETIFENCVADVNIPVGEVFTSPVLKGTDGLLHVSRVFLQGLEFRDLAITFADGMIRDYTCGNFDSEEENRAFVSENILFRHPTLPLGEFAIGTNTTAYVAARRLGVEDKFPILIAEKMGPHFAVGDTCYSHAEEIRVYNPDGKEIVAKENEVSAQRHKKPLEAYFNCHTDITIPYDELEELAAVRADGTRIPIIGKGRFVLPGCEILNEAFGK